MKKNNSKIYSQAVERLEEIVDAIQGGSLDIDSLSVLLKEADELIKFCRAKLYEVDEEVKALLQNIADDSSET